MFVRNVSIQLKPNSITEFTATFDKEVLPSLRKQKGFREELIFATPGASFVTAISFWDTQENADLYNSSVYAEVLEKLSKFVDGTPKVRTAEILHSTFSQLTTAAAGSVTSIDSKPAAAIA
jgi:heme-degrading monooxygenase HmoA